MKKFVCLTCSFSSTSGKAMAKHRCDPPSDGVIRDCQCPRARHQHGTVVAYAKDGCRCARCRLANRNYDRWKAKHRDTPIDDGRVVNQRAHEIMMKADEAAITIPMIAAETRIGQEVLRRIVAKPGCLIERDVDERLAALDIRKLERARDDVDVHTVLPYLKALYALGWSGVDISKASSVPTERITRYLSGSVKRVSVDNASAIERAYRDLWWSEPMQITTDRARALARASRNGWRKPDDDGVPQDL